MAPMKPTSREHHYRTPLRDNAIPSAIKVVTTGPNPALVLIQSSYADKIRHIIEYLRLDPEK
jgi:hypothetical protein